MSVESIKYHDICDSCTYGCCCDMAQFGGHNPRITACSHFAPSKQTNYDRIISKTPKELADWIAQILAYHTIQMYVKCKRSCPLYKCCNDQPSDNIEDWLKSPADKEGE